MILVCAKASDGLIKSRRRIGRRKAFDIGVFGVKEEEYKTKDQVQNADGTQTSQLSSSVNRIALLHEAHEKERKENQESQSAYDQRDGHKIGQASKR